MIALSLRGKLVLAFLGLLLFSFAITGSIFWLRVQEYSKKLTISNLEVAASVLRLPIQRALIDTRDVPLSSALAPALDPELAPRLRLFPGVILLLTSPQDNRVVYPAHPPIDRLPIHFPPQAAGAVGGPPQVSLPAAGGRRGGRAAAGRPGELLHPGRPHLRLRGPARTAPDRPLHHQLRP
jgi:hypothetical protein